jgi:hypothetical protein
MGPRDHVERKDENGRVFYSALVHWRQDIGPAHCLLQAVFLPDGRRLKIFLAQLKTCPRFRGIYHDTDGAANAAWSALEGRFGDLSRLDVEWLFRCGEYSSYDYCPPRTSRYLLTRDSDRRWRFKKYECAPLTAEEKAELLKLTNVPEVEDDLEKLPKMPRLQPHEC